MALLILFGFVAGAATALSPCVLPVLPIALSAGATGGRRRPLGIVAGLAVSFTFATVALVYVISALGLPNDFLRKLAIVVLLGFGIVLMIPPLAARLEAWMSRFASRAGVASARRRRLLVGDRGRRQPRPRLRALRRPDPGRRDHRLRLAVVQRRPARGRAQLRARLGRRPLLPDARRPPRWSRRWPGAARPADRDGAVMVVVALAMLRQLRHPLPEQDRQRPAELPRQPERRARGHGVGAQARWPTSAAAPRTASASRGGGAAPPATAAEGRLGPAGARRGAGIRRQRAAGSTPPASGR